MNYKKTLLAASILTAFSGISMATDYFGIISKKNNYKVVENTTPAPEITEWSDVGAEHC